MKPRIPLPRRSGPQDRNIGDHSDESQALELMRRPGDAVPVAGSAEVEVPVPAVRVLDALAALEGPALTGSAGRQSLERGETVRLVRMNGRTLGISSVEAWELEPRGAVTRVRVDARLDGRVARALRSPLQGVVDHTVDVDVHRICDRAAA